MQYNPKYPLKHLSVRVPWHDSEWNGKFCCDPRENGSCMFLPRIQEAKDLEFEEQNAGKWIHEIKDKKKLPPCVGEKVHFMSPHKLYVTKNHPYAANSNNSDFYGHYRETTLCYPEYSFGVVPYNWMIKDKKTNLSDKAEAFGIDYDASKEPSLSFENTWVQQVDNQRSLLNTFIKPIKPEESLVFVYAKNVPHLDITTRVLIGVGKVTKVGNLTEYEYDESVPNSFKSTLWERPVHHSIREGFKNGFLLPYQEFFKFAVGDENINLEEYIAIAPRDENDTFTEFSYGSEWVSNDSAIESLLILADKLKKFQGVLPDKNYEHQLRWIDNELSRLWKMRGPFPGFGAVISGLKVEQGNFIAWELEELIRDEAQEVVKNPWSYFERLMSGDSSFLSSNLKVTISDTVKSTWQNYTNDEKDFFEFLSRMQVSNELVNEVIDENEKQLQQYLDNPYLLYENTRLKNISFSLTMIDKAIFSGEKLQTDFPLPSTIQIVGGLDRKRLRAACVQIPDI